MIDIQGIFNALKPPSEEISFCEAFCIGKHTFCSHENGHLDRLLDFLGNAHGYHTEWIEQKNDEIKIVVSRDKNEQSWRVRFCENRIHKNKIFLEKITTISLHETIEGMMEKILPHCNEGDVIDIPDPNASAHQRLEWIKCLPSKNSRKY